MTRRAAVGAVTQQCSAVNVPIEQFPHLLGVEAACLVAFEPARARSLNRTPIGVRCCCTACGLDRADPHPDPHEGGSGGPRL
jgi:hypothetical protein